MDIRLLLGFGSVRQWLHHDPLIERGAQAVFVSAVALAVALAARRQGISLFGQSLIALVRGVVQIILVGLVLRAIRNQLATSTPFRTTQLTPSCWKPLSRASAR